MVRMRVFSFFKEGALLFTLISDCFAVSDVDRVAGMRSSGLELVEFPRYAVESEIDSNWSDPIFLDTEMNFVPRKLRFEREMEFIFDEPKLSL